jgi:SAM-dependent methyltransferase
MTVVQSVPEAAGPADPFAVATAPRNSARRRPLSFVGRWGRARRWVPAEARRVLDVGCSFGYGTAAIAAGGPPGRVVVGVEYGRRNVEAARRLYPHLTFLEGDVGDLPVPDGCADAVLLLDVLEHVADPAHALADVVRVLRPGGTLIVSVPHRGLFHRLDSLNVYSALRRRRPHWPPLEPETESAGGVHRHFSQADLVELLRPHFVVDRTARSGLGVAELLYLALLVARVPSGRLRVWRAALPLHLLLYVLDDVIALGPLSYHLTVRATRSELS